MAYSTNKIERRPWTLEEKKSALNSCASKCACCGKKLTMKTLTMEHVVPISKGGENILNNLVVLCKECNSRKGNKFYLPLGYYMALNNNSKLSAIDSYTSKWIDENITNDNLTEYPMFTEAMAMFIQPKQMNYKFKNGAYIPSLILDMYDVDQIDSKPILKSLNIKESDIRESVMDDNDLFSLIAVKKRTSDKYIGLYTLQIDGDNIFINEVYSESWSINRAIVLAFPTTFGKRWNSYGVDKIIIRCKNSDTIKGILYYYDNNIVPIQVCHIMNTYDQFSYIGKEDSIYGENQMLMKTLSKSEMAITKAGQNVSVVMKKRKY